MIKCLSPEELRRRASGKWVDFEPDMFAFKPG